MSLKRAALLIATLAAAGALTASATARPASHAHACAVALAKLRIAVTGSRMEIAAATNSTASTAARLKQLGGVLGRESKTFENGTAGVEACAAAAVELGASAGARACLGPGGEIPGLAVAITGRLLILKEFVADILAARLTASGAWVGSIEGNALSTDLTHLEALTGPCLNWAEAHA